MHTQLIVKNKGLQPYEAIWKEMRDFTETRDSATPDELWLVEHLPIFTQGQAGKPEHLLAPGDIPIIQTDRGGQVTYHGPGQLVVYTLLDIQRRNMGIRGLICTLEQSIINVLSDFGIIGTRREKAPGVYVKDGKIASLGLRIRRGCSYHGLSLNVAMDLTPFSRINPCGFANLKVVQMRDFKDSIVMSDVAPLLIAQISKHINERMI